jgi:hypothetical protein
MNNIKVYDIGKFIDANIKDKKVYFSDRKKAIVIGNKGVVVFDDEAVGWVKDSIQDKVKIGFLDTTDSEDSVIPRYSANITISDLLDAESTEMHITQFVERYNYNSRLKSNYAGILKAIDEIGLNSKDFDSSI